MGTAREDEASLLKAIHDAAGGQMNVVGVNYYKAAEPLGMDRARVQMIMSRLADAGFVKHLGIGGATLTPAGREEVERTTLTEQQLDAIEDQRRVVLRAMHAAVGGQTMRAVVFAQVAQGTGVSEPDARGMASIFVDRGWIKPFGAGGTYTLTNAGVDEAEAEL